MFNNHDIVRVAYQPYTQRQIAGDFIGKVGYIEEQNEDHSRALVQCLTKDGKLAGTTWIPVKCLVRESSQDWQNAYAKYQDWFKQDMREAEARRTRFNNKLSEIASRYSLNVRDVLEISEAVNCLA